MKANYLSKTESSKLLEKLTKIPWLSSLMGRKIKSVFRVEIEDAVIYRIDDVVLVEKSRLIFPTLVEKYNKSIIDSIPSIIVDMGAVSHIVNGADIMRPGIREVAGKFNKDDIVIVRDEKNKKPIAVGITLIDSESLKSMSKGKVAENIHYIDDKLWKLIHQLKDILER